MPKQLKITGKTTEQKFRTLCVYMEERTYQATGLPAIVKLAQFPHWAEAGIEDGVAVYSFAEDSLQKDNEFLTKLAIHELAHVVDGWLFDGNRKDPSGRNCYHDRMWKRLCRILGDDSPNTQM
jgi:hypothetical protein